MDQIKETKRPLPDPKKFVPLKKRDFAQQQMAPSYTTWKLAMMKLTANKFAMASGVVLLLMIIMAVIYPLFTPHDFRSQQLLDTFLAPGGTHYFGTDELGRDLFARAWKGAQISLTVGIVAAIADVILGIIIGGIMGYFGGKVDEVLNKISEILYSIPYLLVVILLGVVLGQGMWTLIIALTATGWINMAWIVRGQIMQLKNQEYVLAARAMGSGGFRILFKHLIPNTMGPIIVTMTLTVPSAIFAEAFLSFLGLGVQSPAASWGVMINDSLTSWTIYPWTLLFPAGMLCLAMLAFNIFGDGLRDAFDPKTRVE
ncbi:ABC transporter permease [Paenibacillus pasadenensis]|uniref:Oligopeptide transport system permease protein OppC n=1 Tax=Paenibacillus pasadenensis TaxID=217090 RepID=A0A2N5N0Z5_9BACL|nr:MULTISPECIES: ABC transporter permease [Paenibacillus]PLT43999.1 Oligopeptide transport system permease protein OppC [Paenibacillus pasadenensis]QGG54558.1 ABC transporter permease subunit [Paenibacillus sp. B01]